MTNCRYATKHGWCALDAGTTCDGNREWCAQFASSAFEEYEEVGHSVENAEELWQEVEKVLGDRDEVWITEDEVDDDDRSD